MKLSTNLSLRAARPQLDYKSRILLVGSCFSGNIGRKLEEYRFENLVNPFGILFHPAAIERFLTDSLAGKPIDETSIVEHLGRYSYLQAHGELSAKTKGQLIDNLKSAVSQTAHFVKNASHLIVSLGTAWGYRFIDTGSIVANCHKLPQQHFNKVLSPIEAIEKNLHNICKTGWTLNPDVEILFTISPVRHLKDGFVENQRSKAHLISAVHSVVGTKDQAHYFPSYEIMMDELRDYRFYERDMLHPNQLAIDFIWNAFVTAHISTESQKLFPLIDEITRGRAHRPTDPESEAHQVFLAKIENREAKLRQLLSALR